MPLLKIQDIYYEARNSHSGLPKALTKGYKEFIHLLVKREPYIIIGEIFQALDKSVSTDTVSRMLKESGCTHVKAWKPTVIKWVNKPVYTIQWPLARTGWAYEQWTKIVWSYVYWRVCVRDFANERPVFLSFWCLSVCPTQKLNRIFLLKIYTFYYYQWITSI